MTIRKLFTQFNNAHLLDKLKLTYDNTDHAYTLEVRGIGRALRIKCGCRNFTNFKDAVKFWSGKLTIKEIIRLQAEDSISLDEIFDPDIRRWYDLYDYQKELKKEYGHYKAKYPSQRKFILAWLNNAQRIYLALGLVKKSEVLFYRGPMNTKKKRKR